MLLSALLLRVAELYTEAYDVRRNLNSTFKVLVHVSKRFCTYLAPANALFSKSLPANLFNMEVFLVKVCLQIYLTITLTPNPNPVTQP